MNFKILTIICSLLLLTGCLMVTSAWSGPRDKKLSLHKSAIQDGKDLGERKDKDIGEGKVKERKSVKRKVAQKAGAAAVTGVAVKKLRSGTKKAVKNVVE